LNVRVQVQPVIKVEGLPFPSIQQLTLIAYYEETEHLNKSSMYI